MKTSKLKISTSLVCLPSERVQIVDHLVLSCCDFAACYLVKTCFPFLRYIHKTQNSNDQRGNTKTVNDISVSEKMAWVKMLNQCSTLTVLLALTAAQTYDVSKIHVKHVYF